MADRVRLTVVGDLLLDRDVTGSVDRVCPDAPVPVLDVAAETTSPGGAGLTALLARADGAEVTIVAPLADDRAGRLLLQHLEQAGVEVAALRQDGATREKTRVRAAGQSLVRIDRGGPATPRGGLTSPAERAIRDADVVLVSCYGAGTCADESVRAALSEKAIRGPVVWDPHPRGATPVAGCVLVTPNLSEARQFARMPSGSAGETARHLLGEWSAQAVAVTAGAEGAALASTRTVEPLLLPARPASGDPCGAGDRFVATAALSLARGAGTADAVRAAVAAASAFVEAGRSAGWRGTSGAAPAPAARRVVATGGCFDVLHAGHIASLTAARALGDELVVLLNSDRSVRRLKGPGRPVNSARDRAAVLRALECVDSVVLFDEDTPADALSRLRPDIWAKGGDYTLEDLPEADLVRSWGGRVELLPVLSGLSSTATLHRLMKEDHRAS